MSENDQKTVLFHGLNTPGHINTLVAIADKLKADYGYRTVFLILGPTWDNSVENHGHEVFALEEKCSLEFEVDEDDDNLAQPADSVSRGEGGKRKIKLTGYYKFENLLRTKFGAFSSDSALAFSDAMKSFKAIAQAEIMENHENFSAALEQIKPDLIIIDVFMVPPSIMNLRGVPWVKVCSANPLSLTKPNPSLGVKPPPMSGFKILDKERRNKMRNERPEEWEAMVESWRSVMNKMGQWMKEPGTTELMEFYQQQGCPIVTEGKWGHEGPYINFYLYPKEIDYDQDDDLFEYPSNFFRCDSLMRKPITHSNSEVSRFWLDKLQEAMKGKKEMVFFSLGSLASGNHKLMQKYVDIFRKDQDRLYVISKGPNGHKYQLDASNMIGGNYVPQTFFLERANLAIIHGGNNSIFECLYFGVPIIVLPIFGDQLDNAQRIEDLGLGGRLDVHQCDEKQLIENINQVLSSDLIVEKVRSIGESMRARDTSTKISRMLKKLLLEKHLDQAFIEECRVKDVDEIEF